MTILTIIAVCNIYQGYNLKYINNGARINIINEMRLQLYKNKQNSIINVATFFEVNPKIRT